MIALMAGGRGNSKEPPGKAFERQVTDAYRTLGFQVVPNVQLPGKQTDVVVRNEVPGAPPITLAIECKDHSRPIGPGEIHKFVERVNSQCAVGIITGGVIVAARGFTADARAAADGHRNISLRSWEELNTEILDVRHQLRDLLSSYEASDIFHNYLPLEIELIGWGTEKPEATSRDLPSVLDEWTAFDGSLGIGALIVLADFGSGKTTLLRNIEYDRATAHLEGTDPRIPLFVPLREFHHSRDVGTLLRSAFREAFYRDLAPELLWRYIEAGRFYLLFDGFDEMIDRSDPERRLDLFGQLMPALRSDSPVILTSRPSFLVGRDELDGLLAGLRAHEAAISGPIYGNVPHGRAVANRLRRRLVEAHREVRPLPEAAQPLNPREVQVVRLRPLDGTRIKEFLDRRAPQLERAGTSVEALVDFIERTYDLADLASRPMLLELILDTVLIGKVDPDDTDTKFGPSGLYEIYVHAKLDLDLAKGPSRERGLSLAARRLLAERLALWMYGKHLLKVDFAEALEYLRAEQGPLRQELMAGGLTDEEIATDFATCSFVTLEGGLCRFVHKSFRGFFIARVLKDADLATEPFLAAPLEREVLYFLGGFAPTEPRVANDLWTKFLETPLDQGDRRRNLLVAYLYTRPDHDTRRVRSAEITDADFGRLELKGTRLESVTWRDTTLRDLELSEGSWRDVDVFSTHIDDLSSRGSRLKATFGDSTIERWDAEDTTAHLDLDASTVYSWTQRGCSTRVVAGDSQIDELKITEGAMLCKVQEESDFSLGSVELAAARFHAVGDWGPGYLRAVDSFLYYGGKQEMSAGWSVSNSCVSFVCPPTAQPISNGAPLEADPTSIIFAPNGIDYRLLKCSAGLIGSMVPLPGRTIFFTGQPTAWGVLEADHLLRPIALADSDPGVRIGDLLLVRGTWLERNFSARTLPVLRELEDQVATPLDSDAHPSPQSLTALLDEVRSAYESLLDRDWPNYERFDAILG